MVSEQQTKSRNYRIQKGGTTHERSYHSLHRNGRTSHKPSPDGEGGSAEALTEEVIPADAESAPETGEEAAPAEEAQPVEEVPAEQPAEEQPAAAAPVANALVYTGEAQPLVSAGEGWLFSMDGETYAPDIPTAVDAGDYTVYFAPADADGEAQAMTVIVAKADVVLIPPEVPTGEA